MTAEVRASVGRFARLCPHGTCALAAALLVGMLLAGVDLYVRSTLPGQMAAFASRPSPIKLTGNILQSEAFRLDRMLTIYGSSELDRPAANRPDEFFRNQPTGFTTFPIGRGGTTCLMILQKVAAVGTSIRGKKVVVFLSPSWFEKESVGENAVGANLSTPQLTAWVFGSGLSVSLREKIVHRLLDYPGPLQDQLLLDHALRCLAEPSRAHRLLFALLQPLGCLENTFFRQIEYCAVLREMRLYKDSPSKIKSRRATPVPTNGSSELDWLRLATEAEAGDRAHHDGAVYSATNALLPENRRAEHLHAQVTGSRDIEFDAKVIRSKEFDDLQLLIDVLKELRVDALFVSQPFNGIYRELGGVSPRARRVFYEKLAVTLTRSGFPLLDFSDHEKDRFFFNDANHPSAKAWIFYNQGIDRFYHRGHG